MKAKHLIWIIPLSFLLGMLLTNELWLSTDMAPENDQVKSMWDCEEGCIYAEWAVYGYKNSSTPTNLYKTCSEACLHGEGRFK